MTALAIVIVIAVVSALAAAALRCAWRYSDLLLDGRAAPLDPGAAHYTPSSVGLPWMEVFIQTDLGPAPAWYVPSRPAVESWRLPPSDTWVILVHGRGGSRLGSLDLLPVLHRLGHPTLTISYRNDGDAPDDPDRRTYLGATEWRDVHDAMVYALDNGAIDVVLLGRSQGGALIGQVLHRSPLADRVSGVVLESPVLDWRAVLTRAGRAYRLPGWITRLAMWLTERRAGLDLDEFDLVTRPPGVRPPTLIFHAVDDDTVPVETSRALVARHETEWPLHLEETSGGHNGSRANDPALYDSLLSWWLYGPTSSAVTRVTRDREQAL